MSFTSINVTWLQLFKYSCISRQLTKERQLSLHRVSSFCVLCHTLVRARVLLLEVRDLHHAAGFPYIHFTSERDSVHPMPAYRRYRTVEGRGGHHKHKKKFNDWLHPLSIEDILIILTSPMQNTPDARLNLWPLERPLETVLQSLAHILP